MIYVCSGCLDKRDDHGSGMLNNRIHTCGGHWFEASVRNEEEIKELREALVALAERLKRAGL